MSTEGIIDTITQRIMDGARRYEPTPQEVRWALIEQQAMRLTRAFDGKFAGVTGEALNALRELRETMEGKQTPKEIEEPQNPLAIIGNRGYEIMY